MPNLRETRRRMRAINQTLQVTRAMNLISTSKLRKGKLVLASVEPYFRRVQQSMREILAGAGDVSSVYLPSSTHTRDNTKGKHHSAVIVITTDKGLAGGYNANVVRYVHSLCEKLPAPIVIIVGNVGQRYFANSPLKVIETFSFEGRLPTLEDAAALSEFVVSQYEWGLFSEIRVVYTHMFNTMKLLPNEKLILPLDAEKLREDAISELELARKNGVKEAELKTVENLHFEYSPSPEAVFDTLAPLYIRGVLYGCLVESYASEQSARMSAMDEASRNGEDMLSRAQISYNRIRQSAITQEVTEIIGGSI
jgi:F-type H+-transporting ATPase subunit gamma